MVDGKLIRFDVDTGSPVTLITEREWRGSLESRTLDAVDFTMHSYSGHRLKVLGCFKATLVYGGRSVESTLYVAADARSNLLGRDSLRQFDIHQLVQTVSSSATDRDERVKAILLKHATLFAPGLGKIAGVKAKLRLADVATPIFHKARPVPISMRPRVEREISRLVGSDVFEKVDFSDWAKPIVPVSKPNDGVRICGDYSVSLNKFLKMDHYPIPRLDDLFAKLAGGRRFTKIDLSDAYLQVELDEESRDCTTVNTHQGLYRYKRMPFGISTAPSIFQAIMDQLISGLEGTVDFFDDFLVTGVDDAAHLLNLDALFTRMEDRGLRLKREKCRFFEDSVCYLGHVIDENGLHTDPGKVGAMVETPRPTSKEQVRAFLGLVNYYGRFVNNLSTRLEPLNRLLRKNATFIWQDDQRRAFDDVKAAMTSAPVLAHYDQQLPLGVAADASSYGLGAVLFHIYSNGTERPIAYASRTLSPAEKNYAQLEREAVAIIFAVRRFQHYLLGRQFVVYSDHKPLEALLGENRPTSATATARLQRWKLFLASFQYEIQYRKSSLMGPADSLSRNPLPIDDATPIERAADVNELEHEQLGVFPNGSAALRRLTEHDLELVEVMRCLRYGWPDRVDKASSLYPYWLRRDELSISEGVLLWGMRVVIPSRGRRGVLEELHIGHLGGARMKGVARSHVWWPGIDAEIEDFVKACELCARTAPDPKETVAHKWDWPDRPWYRLHVDFAGPLHGRMWLVVVDAYSKYPEVVPMPHATSSATVQALRTIFCRFGLPVQLVSDNGTQFTDREFQDFLHKNGISHFRIAPHHPASNGEAERFVQTLKRAIAKAKSTDDAALNLHLNQFLLAYRRSPHSVTGQSPAEVLFGRPIRSKMDLMHPDLGEKMMARRAPVDDASKFSPGALVWVRNFSGPEKWKAGEIVRVLGPRSYEVQVGNQLYHRHEQQVRERKVLRSERSSEEEDEELERMWDARLQARPPPKSVYPPLRLSEDESKTRSRTPSVTPPCAPPGAGVEEHPPATTRASTSSKGARARTKDEDPERGVGVGQEGAPPLRRSSRERRAPKRYEDFQYGSTVPGTRAKKGAH